MMNAKNNYSTQYPAAQSYSMPPQSQGCQNNAAACSPPAHNETMNVSHHVYTQHIQPVTKRWMTHEVQYRHVPVSQETRVVNHPAQDYCVAAAAPCQQAPAPCQQAPRPPMHKNKCTRR